jgi:hypothetical protein
MAAMPSSTTPAMIRTTTTPVDMPPPAVAGLAAGDGVGVGVGVGVAPVPTTAAVSNRPVVIANVVGKPARPELPRLANGTLVLVANLLLICAAVTPPVVTVSITTEPLTQPLMRTSFFVMPR